MEKGEREGCKGNWKTGSGREIDTYRKRDGQRNTEKSKR